MASPWLQGMQFGFDASLRMQELRSQQAERQMREKNRADMLTLEMQKFQVEVDRQAKTAVAAKKFQLLTSPENPNKMLPGSAAIEAFMPIMEDPNQAANLVASAGLANERAQGRAPTANMQEAAAISGLRQQIAAATDPAQKAALQTQLDDLMAVATPAGTTFETTLPDGTVTRMTTGRQPASPGGLTTAASTEVQKKAMATRQALATASNAIKTIRENPKAIGPLGVVRDITERGKGIIGMEGDAPVAKARHQLALDFTQLAEGLRVDTDNMSLYERKQLEKVGDATGWTESQQTAEDMMLNIQKALIGKQLRLLRAEGKSPDDELLLMISPQDFLDLVDIRNNLISKKDGERWYDLRKSRLKK